MRAEQNRTEQIKLGFIFHFECAITAVSIKYYSVFCVWSVDQLGFRRIENQENGMEQKKKIPKRTKNNKETIHPTTTQNAHRIASRLNTTGSIKEEVDSKEARKG